MKNSGLILRKEADGISIFFDNTRTEALTLYASDPFDPLILNFKVHLKNPLFENFTQLPSFEENTLLFFDTATAVSQPGGAYRLTHDDHVSSADLMPMDSPPLLPLLSRSDRVVRPLCILSVHVPAAPGALFDAKTYYLEFPVRKTIWKYYLLGKYTKEDVSVMDLNDEIIFIQGRNEMVFGNQKALVFESDLPLALTQSPLCRFQLKKQTSNISKVLVKRLPVASPDQLAKRMNQENNKEYVSEIFINP